MYEEVIYLSSGVLGFVAVFIIASQHRKNNYANIYLIAILLFSSIRYFVNGIPNESNNIFFLKQLNLFYFVSVSPFAYLYFKNLTYNQQFLLNKDLFHLSVIPIFFIIINTMKFTEIEELKFKFVVLMVLNFTYIIKSYLVLKRKVWNRNSDVFLISQQNKTISKWTLILFSFFIFNFVCFCFFFFIKLLIYKNQFWFNFNNSFLLLGAIFWLFLFVKILYSPEFLYGYEIIQNKIKEYKKNTIAFDNIWILDNSVLVTNIQDSILKEKIVLQIEEYILQIERLSLGSSIFLSKNFDLYDLANKLNIPKSHLVYVFKYHSKISFLDFKKIIRIQRSILLISEGFLNNHTIDSLASEVGFSTYSSFFKSFKNIMGVSPQEYYIQIKIATN
ncbi:MAG: AraC family transcriptional regulator [Flavobacterium sp.]|nr:AraC family transcriptional regulator [Flavobacterium sp.]